MSKEDDLSIGFVIPNTIKDFIFDLHDSCRRALILDEVQRLYEAKGKEITDKYFSSSPWPDAKSIAGEVENDEFFLCLYRYFYIHTDLCN